LELAPTDAIDRPELLISGTDSLLHNPFLGQQGTVLWPVAWKLTKKTTPGGWIVQDVTWKYTDANGVDITQELLKAMGKPNIATRYYEAWKVRKESTGDLDVDQQTRDGLFNKVKEMLFIIQAQLYAKFKSTKLTPAETAMYNRSKIVYDDETTCKFLARKADFFVNPPVPRAAGKWIVVGKAWFVETKENVKAPFKQKNPQTFAGVLWSFPVTPDNLQKYNAWEQGKYVSNVVAHSLTATWTTATGLTQVTIDPPYQPKK
jgi:hypothetical protein